jgi:hypothetical protein
MCSSPLRLLAADGGVAAATAAAGPPPALLRPRASWRRRSSSMYTMPSASQTWRGVFGGAVATVLYAQTKGPCRAQGRGRRRAAWPMGPHGPHTCARACHAAHSAPLHAAPRALAAPPQPARLCQHRRERRTVLEALRQALQLVRRRAVAHDERRAGRVRVRVGEHDRRGRARAVADAQRRDDGAVLQAQLEDVARREDLPQRARHGAHDARERHGSRVPTRRARRRPALPRAAPAGTEGRAAGGVRAGGRRARAPGPRRPRRSARGGPRREARARLGRAPPPARAVRRPAAALRRRRGPPATADAPAARRGAPGARARPAPACWGPRGRAAGRRQVLRLQKAARPRSEGTGEAARAGRCARRAGSGVGRN